MSAPRGKRTRRGVGDETGDEARGAPGGRVPELLRRVVGMGFSGFFLTEEVVRRALGETLPREWVDFAAAQSERTRRELIDRVASEIGRTLDGADLPRLAERLLRGHTIEVTARVRFVPHEDPEVEASKATSAARGRGIRVTVRDAEEES